MSFPRFRPNRLIVLLLLFHGPILAQPIGDPVAENGLLWRVVSAQGKVSHLYGTMHSADSRVTALAPPVQAAFKRARRVVLELDMTAETLSASGAMLMYSGDRRLADDVPEPLLSEVRSLGSRKGLSFLVLSRLKPWGVAVTLAAPSEKQGEFLDVKLASAAREAGKPVIGLETVEEQLSTFNNLSVADQLALLRDIVDEYEELPRFYRALEQAYLDGNLTRILELSEQDLDNADSNLAERLLSGLIDRRNLWMAERMQPALQAGDSFVAVGALHLPGANGLLQLLRERGYRVSAIY